MEALPEHLSTALVGRYHFERELGRGGMATVYLAEDIKHRRKVAIKVLKPELAIALGPERFLREIDIAAKLTHPHILPLLDSGEADGSLYYVMPYVSGDSLRDRLEREGQLTIEEAIRLTCEVASALDYAHRSGVVHRDVKPENILLVDGHAVVADFGIARAVSRAGGDTLTSTGLALGTPAYMSPEQASGEREVDARSDIYSLGCVIYEMLAGEPPFTGHNALAVIAKRLSQPVPSVRVLRESVPERLDRVVRRALSRLPADRYDTADALRRALESTDGNGLLVDVDSLEPGSRSARPPTKSKPTPRTKRRRRLLVAALGAVTVVGGGWWAFNHSRANAQRIQSVAVLPFENISRDPNQQYFVDGMHEAIIGELAQIGALQVTSRTSALHYKGSGKTIPEIARELNVDAVVEGSVLSAGDSVRIHVELIGAAPRERYLWGQTYDRHVRDVLSLHSEVAQSVAQQIQIKVTPEERTRLARTRVVNPEAYRQYLIGNFQQGKYNEAAFRQAIEHYQEAINIDSGYAPAYAAEAVTYIELGSWASSLPPAAVQAKARAAALAALERDSTLAEAHIALGLVKQLFEWDWSGAEAEYRRGIALKPRATYALLVYSTYLMSVGRFDQALAINRRVVELDPLSGNGYFQVGWALDHLGRDVEALQEYQKGLELMPENASLLLELAEFHSERGRFEVAFRYAEKAESVLGRAASPTWMCRLGYDYAIAHHRADALRILNELRRRAKREYVPPASLAIVYAGLGQKEVALTLLEEAYKKHDVILVWVKVRHQFDSLRADPRFQDVLRRMNFPS